MLTAATNDRPYDPVFLDSIGMTDEEFWRKYEMSFGGRNHRLPAYFEGWLANEISLLYTIDTGSVITTYAADGVLKYVDGLVTNGGNFVLPVQITDSMGGTSFSQITSIISANAGIITAFPGPPQLRQPIIFDHQRGIWTMGGQRFPIRYRNTQLGIDYEFKFASGPPNRHY